MKSKESEKPAIWRIILSTLAAAFGVQSNRNREQDFTHGNIYVYIVSGLIFTVLFIVVIAMIVSSVLPTQN